MSRLPVVTGDINTWGTVLNDYLSVAHNADGTLKAFYNPVDSKYNADPTGAAFSTTAFTNCINDANAYNSNPDGVGAAIVVPPGYFKLNAALPTIKVPLIGSGMRRTIFKQTVNLGTAGGLGGGTGVPTLVFDDPLSVQQSVFGARFSLIGPGSMGAMGAHLSAGAGIQCNTQMHLDNVEVRLFDVGGVTFNCLGGHIILHKCTIVNNYYNIWYWLDHGNNGARDCILVGPAFASIATNGGTNIDFAYYDNCHLGFGPYGIYQDNQITAGQGDSQNIFMGSGNFNGVYFESIGNGCLFTENAAGRLEGCRFTFAGQLNNPGFKIASRAADWAIVCGQTSGCKFHGFFDMGLGTLTTTGSGVQGFTELAMAGARPPFVNIGDNPWFRYVGRSGYPRHIGQGSIGSGASSTTIAIDFAGLRSQVQNIVLTPTNVGAQTGGFALYVTNILTSQGNSPISPGLALVTAAGNLGVGTYTYGVTYVNGLGETTVDNTAQITTDATHKQVTVTVPLYLDTSGATSTCTARKIYRGVVGSSSPLKLLTTINDNTTTSFTDNVADASLGVNAPSSRTAQGTTFTVNCQPANPVGAALNFNFYIPENA